MSIILDSIMLHMDRTYLETCLVEGGNTLFFTITNHGYKDYTHNMLLSLRKFQVDKKVLIVCIDTESNTYFQKEGYVTYLLNLGMSDFTEFRQNNFDKICYAKLLLIYKFLCMGYHVLYTDGDIVYANDPVAYLESQRPVEGDMWIQNDSVIDDSYQNVCAGFMYVRSSEVTKRYFNIEVPHFVPRYEDCVKENNDQTYLNRYIIPYLHAHLFPLKQFPNGNYYYHFHQNIPQEALIMVHFNWVVGHTKMEKMKEYGMWWIPEEP